MLTIIIDCKSEHLNTTVPAITGIFPTQYPVVMEATSLSYFLLYLQQLSVCITSSVASWCADSMFLAFLYYLNGHFQILINNIVCVDGNENVLDEEIEKKKYKKIVDHHRFLLR